MACGCCFRKIADAHFDARIAQRDVDRYRKDGPGVTTRLLAELLTDTDALDGTLLDVGSGKDTSKSILLNRYHNVHPPVSPQVSSIAVQGRASLPCPFAARQPGACPTKYDRD